MSGRRWIRGTVAGVHDDGCTVAVRTEADWTADVPAVDCHVQNERDDTLDDLVKSDYLHEAGCAGTRFRVRLGPGSGCAAAQGSTSP